MVKGLFFFVLTALMVGCANGNIVARKDCRVVAILDGDTLECVDTQLNQPKKVDKIKVRLAYIDAPEKGQTFGQVSKRSLSDMVYQKQVTLKIHGQDKYNRTLPKYFTMITISINK